MKLIVSLGREHLARVLKTAELSWQGYVDLLLKVQESNDKASRGWSCPVEFSPAYRDSENFQHRYALTLDYDHVTASDMLHIREVYAPLQHLAYTTWSHTEAKPRWRYVIPLSRPATYDEFQAISRRVAARAGIELAARESHVPAQCMFLPTIRPGETLQSIQNPGKILDVDEVLAEYENWTDKTQWPHRAEADGVQEHGLAVDPTTKPGIVGAFCRAYSVPAAIARFRLPYVPTDTPDRLTYTAGSRPEGAIVYDDGKKLHSHHDTDPARGQTNAFDLVRLHLYGLYDSAADLERPVTERPSFKCMAEAIAEDPLVQAATAAAEFTDLGPAEHTSSPEAPPKGTWEPLARPLSEVLANPTQTRWLLRDELEQGVIALMAGPRGSYKSFKALHWAMRVALEGHAVYVVSAEGGDFGRRAEAWAKHHGHKGSSLPVYVVERRLDLNSRDGVEAIRQDCKRLDIRPVLFVLDTFSKLSGGLDENDNSEVKLFLGRLDNGLKRPSPQAFDATVLLVAHTGHSDNGRARGASALEADTDACYIVSRDAVTATVAVSRERFKSSPELPPLVYKPRIVTLDRLDDDMLPVTSLILEPAEGQDAVRVKGPRGKNQKLLWKALKELAPAGEPLDISRLLDVASSRMPLDRSSGRDLRRQNCRKALDALLDEGHVYLHPNDCLSTTPGHIVTAEDWLE